MSGYANRRYEQYRQQIRNACRRGIVFDLTFQQWLDWWGEDLARRGNHRHDLVMARKGDEGPYALGNILKLTCSENRSQCFGYRLGSRRKAPRIVFRGETGYVYPKRRTVRTPLGVFRSTVAAGKAHGVTAPAIAWRCRNMLDYWFEDDLTRPSGAP